MAKKKKKVSQARIRANRMNAKKSTGPKTEAGKRQAAINAQKSTGPKTAKGKANAAFNATKHGYWSKPSVLKLCLNCPRECTYSWPPESCIKLRKQELSITNEDLF
ncbi:hypothetical protein MFMK1_001125 [Metallumcola ferriviriculae]|uniref:Uncharacterized protein n=1 Tax=Metallumcola ferriviriculae TaxID=3039180 RepID=A0AAU0UM97_9FIRM|nr:hypothetical protein MFMK1_001125 [Desulfitibacteraceae bacterium MK1]